MALGGVRKVDSDNVLTVIYDSTLQAWKEYFPNANVIGVDIVDVVPEKYRTDNVTRIISDIKKVDFEEGFDIIIDDGSHYLGDMVYVVANHFMTMKKGKNSLT